MLPSIDKVGHITGTLGMFISSVFEIFTKR